MGRSSRGPSGRGGLHWPIRTHLGIDLAAQSQAERPLPLRNTCPSGQQLARGKRVNLRDMRRDIVPMSVRQTSSARRLQTRPISYSPKAFLAFLLTISCTCTLLLNLQALAAAPAGNKKKSADPVLKGLPVTELSPGEAIQHALNRLA